MVGLIPTVFFERGEGRGGEKLNPSGKGIGNGNRKSIPRHALSNPIFIILQIAAGLRLNVLNHKTKQIVGKMASILGI